MIVITIHHTSHICENLSKLIFLLWCALLREEENVFSVQIFLQQFVKKYTPTLTHTHTLTRDYSKTYAYEKNVCVWEYVFAQELSEKKKIK